MDLPAPVPEGIGELDDLTARGALAAEVARAFATAATVDAEAARVVADGLRTERDAAVDRLEGLGELHDRLIEALGAGPTAVDHLGATWGRLLVDADRLGLPGVVAELASWIDAVVDDRSLLERLVGHPPGLGRLPAQVAAAAAAETGRLARLSEALDRADAEVAAYEREAADHAEDRRAAQRLVVAATRRRDALLT